VFVAFQSDATIEKVQNLERDDDLTCEIEVTGFGFKALERREKNGFACKIGFGSKPQEGIFSGSR
jgi:hypothetical protein